MAAWCVQDSPNLPSEAIARSGRAHLTPAAPPSFPQPGGSAERSAAGRRRSSNLRDVEWELLHEVQSQGLLETPGFGASYEARRSKLLKARIVLTPEFVLPKERTGGPAWVSPCPQRGSATHGYQ